MKFFITALTVLLTISILNAESVTSTIHGGIVKYLPDQGQTIKAGEIIVKYDLATINFKIKKKKLALELAKEDLEDKKSDLERYQTLTKKNAISRCLLEDCFVDYHTARLKYEELKIELEELESEKGDHTIIAPYNCKINNRLVMINSGVEVGEGLLEVEKLN